jgi:hypothetical protein
MSNVTSTSKKDMTHEMEKGKEAATGLVEKAKDVASNVGQAVGGVATNVGHKVDEAAGSVGSGMHNLGEKMREKGPESGFIGKASQAVANTLEEGGRYLQEKRLSGMAEDLAGVIRRNPIPALLIGVGLGFLLARTLRS